MRVRGLPPTTGREPRRRSGSCPGPAGQTPTMARARDDLPDALGPITPSAWPALSWKATPWTTSRWLPGGFTLTASSVSEAAGVGSSMRAGSAGSMPSRPLRRRQLWRAAMKPRQLAIATSTGASARDVRIELAMMMPADGLLIDHQLGADPQHRRLQRHAQDLATAPPSRRRCRPRAAARARWRWLCSPHSSASRPRHAHGLDDLGVAPAGFGQRHPAVGQPGRPRAPAGGSGYSVSSVMVTRITPPTVAAHADQRMEQEADAEIERHPRQVEQRRRAHGRHERPDAVEVVQRLIAGGRHRLQRQLGGDIVDPPAQRFRRSNRRSAPGRGRARRRAGPGSRT